MPPRTIQTEPNTASACQSVAWSSITGSRDLLDIRSADEERRIAFGTIEGRLFACIYTMRGSVYRIISVRKANRREKRKWLP